MILAAAGLLIALIDRSDNGHGTCASVLPRMAKAMVMR